MKFVTVNLEGGLPGILLEDGSAVLFRDALPAEYRDMNDFIVNHTEKDIALLRAAERGNAKAVKAPLLAPIPSSLHDIICVGVNYWDHLKESQEYKGKTEAPEETVYFAKRGAEITGPDAVIPLRPDLDACLDYEVELAVVIGKKLGRKTCMEEIPFAVFGYTIFNDISARTLQNAHSQWYYGKSLDGASVMGPFIAYRDDYDGIPELGLYSKVNGEVRQSSNTRLLRKSVAELIYELTRGITLYPGDILSTGTPAGAGMGFKPPRWLKAGDTVECGIETLGALRNTVG